MSALSVVWFKRDLRVQDAQPLSQAASVSKILPLMESGGPISLGQVGQVVSPPPGPRR